MRRELPQIRLAVGLTATLTALTVSLAGCGSSAGGTAGPATDPTAASSPARPAAGASSPADELALSHLRVLTKLKQAQLCGVLSAAEAARILGTTTAPPIYASRRGRGITCQWVKRGADPASADQLYVGISTLIDWTGAQAADKLLPATGVRIDGHPALGVDDRAKIGWAQVDVALGGDHDPVADYRAPTMAGALALAKEATPILLAQG